MAVTSPPSESRIKLIYDGPAVRRGKMSATDVGKAIIGMATTVTRAGQVLHGEKAPPVEVAIEPRFVRGSFEIQFIIDLHELIQTGLLAAIFRDLFNNLRGRDESIGIRERPQHPSDLERLRADPQLRRAVHDIVRPLSHDGVDVLGIMDDSDLPEFEQLSIFPEEAPLFGAGTRTLSRSEGQDDFIVIKPSFRPRTVWRLASIRDENEFSAYMRDPHFSAQVYQGQVVFRRGDQLRATLRTTTKERYGNIQVVREITEVHEHRRGT